MLVLWMVYALFASALVIVIASAAERRIRRRRRLYWSVALLGAALLPASALLPTRATPDRAVTILFGTVQPVLEAPAAELERVVLASADRFELTRFLTAGWAGATALLIGLLALGATWTQRKRRTWEAREVDGTPVYVSEDVGPAVVGILDGAIVLPRWALDLPEPERRMILAHEQEHRSARDPLLLALAYVGVALVPWNAALWFGLRRLRDAVETDCDSRVLARLSGPRERYARLLLESGTRTGTPVPVGAGFGERASSLERRIRTMLGLDLDRGWKGWATRIGLVALLAVGACSLEVNIHLDSDDEEAVPVEATDVELPPTIEIPAPSEDGAARIETPDPIVATAEEDEVEVPTDPELPLDPDDFPVSEPTEVEMRRRSPEEVLAEAPTFTPYTRAPQILNRMEVIQAMEAEYPEQLKAAGIGGTVKIYYFIDAEGRVRDTRLDVSSGQRDLDAAAMRVASVYRFSPALNRDEPVPVWVSFPITFAVR